MSSHIMLQKFQSRLVILAACFIASGIGAFLVLSDEENVNSYKKSGNIVAINDTAAIQAIRVMLPDRKTLSLERERNAWQVNGKYTARPQLITLLLFGLGKLEVKRPLESDKDKVIRKLKEENLRVEVKAKDYHKVFYMMPNPNDVNSSYYLEEGKPTPYIVTVPGVKGELSNLLRLKENDWRSRDIFKSTFRTLKQIQLQYQDKKQEGFVIEYADGFFKVPGIEKVDSLKLKKYISLYSILSGEQYIEDATLKNQLLKRVPAATITVADIDSARSNTLRIYFEQQKLLGIVDRNNEMMLLNPQVFKYVLVDKGYFKK